QRGMTSRLRRFLKWTARALLESSRQAAPALASAREISAFFIPRSGRTWQRRPLPAGSAWPPLGAARPALPLPRDSLISIVSATSSCWWPSQSTRAPAAAIAPSMNSNRAARACASARPPRPPLRAPATSSTPSPLQSDAQNLASAADSDPLSLWLKCRARSLCLRPGQWAQSSSSRATESAPPESATAHLSPLGRESAHSTTCGCSPSRGIRTAVRSAAPGQSTRAFFMRLAGRARSGEREVLLAEVRDEGRRDPHAAVRPEVVLDQRGEDARHGEPGAVERVDKLDLAALPGAEADLGAPRLEGLEVRAARDLEPALLAGRPDLEVVLLGLGEPELAPAHEEHAVRDLELPEQRLHVVAQSVELLVACRGVDPLQQLDLVELVDAVEAAHVLAVAPGLPAEAGRVGAAAHGQGRLVEDLVPEEVREGHLGGRDGEEPVGRRLVHLALLVRELPRGRGARGVDKDGRRPLHVARPR